MIARALRIAAALTAAVITPQGLCADIAADYPNRPTSSTSEQYPNRPIRLIVPFPSGGLDASRKQGSRLRDATDRESAAAAVFIAQTSGTSEQYPNRPIRLIVPFPPGGGTDIVARAVTAKLVEGWGQQIIIDNRGGAGGVIGADTVAKSTPDGYTLLFGTPGALVINPLMNSKLPYNALRDFTPVSLLALNPQLLAVHPSIPVTNVKELIAHAKAQPGKLNYGSVGEGTPNHLAMELFKTMTGTDLVHVPYKGAAPAITDLVGGHVQVMFNPMPPLLPHVKSGRLRALAVGSKQRTAALPDIPTVAEAGVPGYEYVTWYSIFAPAKTSRAIVMKLNARLAAVLALPDIAQRLSLQGAEPKSSTPEELARFMQEDTARLGAIIRTAHIKTE